MGPDKMNLRIITIKACGGVEILTMAECTPLEAMKQIHERRDLLAYACFADDLGSCDDYVPLFVECDPKWSFRSMLKMGARLRDQREGT